MVAGSPYERELRDEVAPPRGYLGIRAGASLGVDVVLTKPRGIHYDVQNGTNLPEVLSRTLLVEVKSTKKDAFSPKMNDEHKEQFTFMKELARRGHLVYYAICFKGTKKSSAERWRFFPINEDTAPEPMRWDGGKSADEVLA